MTKSCATGVHVLERNILEHGQIHDASDPPAYLKMVSSAFCSSSFPFYAYDLCDRRSSIYLFCVEMSIVFPVVLYCVTRAVLNVCKLLHKHIYTPEIMDYSFASLQDILLSLSNVLFTLIACIYNIPYCFL